MEAEGRSLEGLERDNSFSLWERLVRGEIPLVTLKPIAGGQDHEILIIYGGTTQPDFRFIVKKNWAEKLAHRGFTVHCFDFRSNVGGNDFYQFGLYDRFLDADRVANWLLFQPTRMRRLTLVGVSMGGHIATQLAAKLENKVADLILVAPAAYHDEAIQPDLKFSLTEDGEFTQILRRPEGWRESSIFSLAQRVTANTLIIAFQDDEVVKSIPWKYQEVFLSSTMKHVVRPRFVSCPGGHGKNFTDPERISFLLQEITEFLS